MTNSKLITLQPDPQTIIRHMRRMVREQVAWNVDVDLYILQNGLVKETRWPAYCLTITETGMDYIRENTSEGVQDETS